MPYVKRVLDGYIILAGKGMIGEEISESEYNSIQSSICNRPLPVDGHTYKLRSSTLDEETALIRYANTLTGENDTTLIDAAETMCIKLSKEE